MGPVLLKLGPQFLHVLVPGSHLGLPLGLNCQVWHLGVGRGGLMRKASVPGVVMDNSGCFKHF